MAVQILAVLIGGAIGAVVGAGTGYAIHWYTELPAAKKAEVRSIAADIAWEVFRKVLEDLTRSQLELVMDRARDQYHLAN